MPEDSGKLADKIGAYAADGGTVNINKLTVNASDSSEVISFTLADWREICIAMLESQQAAARLRRKATEQGFEVNVYVPLGPVERKQQQRRQQDEQPDRENVCELTKEVIVTTYEHGAFLREVIAQQPAEKNKHIAIIGEPGAGKTTLLSTIASFIKDKTQNLPICISLANLQGKTIEEYLRQQWLTEAMSLVKPDVKVTSEIEHQLLACFAKGGVWLLLDGVDEMGENSPGEALDKINQLTASLRQARVVLTCRLNVWDAKVSNPLTGFDTYKTQEFKPEQIDDFIQQWFQRAGDLAKGKTLQAKLKETKHENIRKLVTNPLCLSLLCQTFDVKQGELPGTKASLYQRFTRYLYEWKSELFPDLYKSDDLKDELHHALSKLAFAGINTQAGFRLTKKLAREQMTEKLFQIACNSFWLILVERTDEDDEEVYTFFHPNFQEYFAALKVDDWQKDFFNHVPGNVTQGTYRIFEPQWKEVILLWLGRNNVASDKKEAFIHSLVKFYNKSECWKNIDPSIRGFYEFSAYCIAAASTAEFEYSNAEEIVHQIIKWCTHDFNSQEIWMTNIESITNLVKEVLPQIDRTIAIDRLVSLISNPNFNYDIKYEAINILGQIGSGSQVAINSLVSIIRSTNIDSFLRYDAIVNLGQIAFGEQTAINILMELICNFNLDKDTKFIVADSLGKISVGNEKVISGLIELITKLNVEKETKHTAIISLGKIGIGNTKAINALKVLISSSNLDYHIKYLAAKNLEKICSGDPMAINALKSLIYEPNVDYYTKYLASEHLVKIDSDNITAIDALIDIIRNRNVDKKIKNKAVNSLRRIGSNKQNVINALIKFIDDPNEDDLISVSYYHVKHIALEILGEISFDNQIVIDYLINLINNPSWDNRSKYYAAKSLYKINPNRQYPIDILANLITNRNLDFMTKPKVADSLGEICFNNQNVIDNLMESIHNHNLDNHSKFYAIKVLQQIGSKKINVVDCWMFLIRNPNVDKDTKYKAIEQLAQILNQEQKNFFWEALKICLIEDKNENSKHNIDLFSKGYTLIWKFAQNTSYPDFHNAWYEEMGKGDGIEAENLNFNNFGLPQCLQDAIKNDPHLSQNIHLICIDTSKFIDPDNPASKIYTAIVKAGYPKCPDGTPGTMAELQTYWDLLETDKRVVLVFHPGAINTISEATHSKVFLNAISKFEGKICLISDPIPDYNTLKVFTLNPSVDEILEWLGCI